MSNNGFLKYVIFLFSALVLAACCDCNQIDINKPDTDIADEDLMLDINEEGDESLDMDEDSADADAVLSNVIFVKSNADGADNGTSWENAFTDLQDALSAAIPGDEIWVAKGIYYPTDGKDREISFKMVESVFLYGGFAGTETEKGERDFEKNETILSGDIGTKDDISDNSYHVVIGADNAELDGFTVADGNADGSEEISGGGMLNDGVDQTVVNCTFKNNFAIYGGGISNFHNRNKITACIFVGNNAKVEGGAIQNVKSSPVIENCTFENNTAGHEDFGGSKGGGISNSSSNSEIRNSVFNKNTSYDSGGGMYNEGGSPIIADCVFSENKSFAEDAGYNKGGGMYNYLSSPAVTGCTFSKNIADFGGAILNEQSSAKISGSIFSDNSAEESGGGIENWASSPVITNCLFTKNSAVNGGAITNSSSSSLILNCTFSANEASSGGGIINYRSSPKITNCILWGNTASEDGDSIFDFESYPEVTFSDVEGSYIGKGNINSDPLFVDPENGDFHLQVSSPCVNAGDNFSYNSINAEVDEDLDGNPREVDDKIDMGAYEFQ